MSRLSLAVLGTPQVRHFQQVLQFRTRKALALLLYLAIEGGMHPREKLHHAVHGGLRKLAAIHRHSAAHKHAVGNVFLAGLVAYVQKRHYYEHNFAAGPQVRPKIKDNSQCDNDQQSVFPF